MEKRAALGDQTSHASQRFQVRRNGKLDGKSEDAQKAESPLQFWKHFLFAPKFAGMHTPAYTSQLHRMLQVQHLVENDIFDGVTRNAGIIKDAADYDRVVCRIVMPQSAARVMAAPG